MAEEYVPPTLEEAKGSVWWLKGVAAGRAERDAEIVDHLTQEIAKRRLASKNYYVLADLLAWLERP